MEMNKKDRNKDMIKVYDQVKKILLLLEWLIWIMQQRMINQMMNQMMK